MSFSVTELPFNKFLGLETAAEPALLKLPTGGHYLNHLGTVHASALLSLAEAASGEFLLRNLGITEPIIPVVRRLEAKFRKPAHGSVTAAVSTPVDQLDQTRAEIRSKGRALVTVEVQLHDEAGTHVFSATVDWFIAKTQE